MKRVTLLGVAAIALWSVGAFAQGRDFGGTWAIDQEKTAASQPAGAMRGAGGGGRGGAVAVASTGGEVRQVAGGAAAGGFVAAGGGGGARGGGGAGAPTEAAAVRRAPETTISLNTQTNTFSLNNGQTTTAYKLDGTAQTIETPRGQVTAKAAWKADKLVIETTTSTDNGPLVSTATWYREGDWLVRENSRPGPNNGDPIVSKTYFKKATPGL